jgi:hypothetical protein
VLVLRADCQHAGERGHGRQEAGRRANAPGMSQTYDGGLTMRSLPHRASMAIVLLIVGGLLSVVAGPSPLVIRVPWLAIHVALVALVTIGGPLLRDWLARRETEDTRYE